MLVLSGPLLGFLAKYSPATTSDLTNSIMAEILLENGYIKPRNISGFFHDIIRTKAERTLIIETEDPELIPLNPEKLDEPTYRARTEEYFKTAFETKAESNCSKLNTGFRQDIFQGLTSSIFTNMFGDQGLERNKIATNTGPCKIIYSPESNSLKIQNSLTDIIVTDTKYLYNEQFKIYNKDSVNTLLRTFQASNDQGIDLFDTNTFEASYNYRIAVQENISIDLNDNKGFRLESIIVYEEQLENFIFQRLVESYIIPAFVNYLLLLAVRWKNSANYFTIGRKKEADELEKAAKRILTKINLDRDYLSSSKKDLVDYFCQEYYRARFPFSILEIYSFLQKIQVDDNPCVNDILSNSNSLRDEYSRWIESLKQSMSKPIEQKKPPTQKYQKPKVDKGLVLTGQTLGLFSYLNSMPNNYINAFGYITPMAGSIDEGQGADSKNRLINDLNRGDAKDSRLVALDDDGFISPNLIKGEAEDPNIAIARASTAFNMCFKDNSQLIKDLNLKSSQNLFQITTAAFKETDFFSKNLVPQPISAKTKELSHILKYDKTKQSFYIFNQHQAIKFIRANQAPNQPPAFQLNTSRPIIYEKISFDIRNPDKGYRLENVTFDDEDLANYMVKHLLQYKIFPPFFKKINLIAKKWEKAGNFDPRPTGRTNDAKRLTNAAERLKNELPVWDQIPKEGNPDAGIFHFTTPNFRNYPASIPEIYNQLIHKNVSGCESIFDVLRFSGLGKLYHEWINDIQCVLHGRLPPPREEVFNGHEFGSGKLIQNQPVNPQETTALPTLVQKKPSVMVGGLKNLWW